MRPNMPPKRWRQTRSQDVNGIQAIASNNFKAVCDSVNYKVPITVGVEVVYSGLSVKWGCDHGLWVY